MMIFLPIYKYYYILGKITKYPDEIYILSILLRYEQPSVQFSGHLVVNRAAKLPQDPVWQLFWQAGNQRQYPRLQPHQTTTELTK